MSRIDISKVRIPGTHLQGWRAIALGALALYILLLIVVNNHKLEVNFVAFKFRSNELLALIVILALGFVAGFIVRGRRRTERPGTAEPTTLEARAEPTTTTHPDQGTAPAQDDGPTVSTS